MKQNALVIIPARDFEEGRRIHLSAREREARLKRPGEVWVELSELPDRRRAGWKPVEMICHGERGSWRETLEV